MVKLKGNGKTGIYMTTINNDHKLRSVEAKSPSQSKSGTEGPSRRKAGISASLRQDCITKYARNAKTISGRLHDELVMMDLDQGKYFSLNPVATRIWDLLEKPMDTDELCGVLIGEYDVEPERCRIELEEHLTEMVKMGLVLKQED